MEFHFICEYKSLCAIHLLGNNYMLDKVIMSFSAYTSPAVIYINMCTYIYCKTRGNDIIYHSLYIKKDKKKSPAAL